MSRTIFITGATAGIGLASARKFAADGWRVIGTGRRKDRLDALAEELGEMAHTIELDMRDLAGIDGAVEALPESFRGVDVLLNNAGYAPPLKPQQDSDLSHSVGVIETNVTGLVAITRKLLPTLVARKGVVVNLSSIAATYPYPNGAVYGGTKAFVRQFSLDLRCDLHGTGVRVTSIEPGMVETEFTLVRTGSQQASDTLYADMSPLTGEDIADTIFWAATQPPHVNINALEIMPVNQSFAGFAVARQG